MKLVEFLIQVSKVEAVVGVAVVVVVVVVTAT
jgi:hypothetical protein